MEKPSPLQQGNPAGKKKQQKTNRIPEWNPQISSSHPARGTSRHPRFPGNSNSANSIREGGSGTSRSQGGIWDIKFQRDSSPSPGDSGRSSHLAKESSVIPEHTNDPKGLWRSWAGRRWSTFHGDAQKTRKNPRNVARSEGLAG